MIKRLKTILMVTVLLILGFNQAYAMDTGSRQEGTQGATEKATQLPHQAKTLSDVVAILHQELKLNFVYDSNLKLDVRFQGTLPDLQKLKKQKLAEQEVAIQRIFAPNDIRCHFSRKHVVLKKKTAEEKAIDQYLDTATVNVLRESFISDWRNRKITVSQTGFKKITGEQLKQGVSFLSQPDVIKNLQLLPGVAAGTELLSGLYVHGGDGRDNLFLMDGVEIYSVSHLAGLFSSFNVDAINGLEFYKSGFPARFGGKLSSVIDVTSKEGDLYEHHGSFSIGLLNGSIQVDGPIVKGKTTYNLGLRRSWLEPFTVPVFAIMNKKDPSHKKMGLRYSLSDFNASITHRFNERHKLSFNLYAGQDFGKYRQITPTVEYWNAQRFLGENKHEYGLRWGNLLASLNWKYLLNEDFALNAIGYYTQSRTHVLMDIGTWSFNKRLENPSIINNYQNEDNGSRIQDAGFKADFFWEPDRGNHIRFGTDLKMHFYHASQDIHYHQDLDHAVGDAPISRSTFFEDHSKSHYTGSEINFYAEYEIGYLDWLKANLGARYVVFFVPGKTYQRLEPRAALQLQFCPAISFKASYTEMNQFTHKMSTHTIELPTFSFLPSNDKIRPMHSRQAAAGIYTRLPSHLTFNVEGFYKTMDHLMEYKGNNSYAPTVTDWQINFSEGKGRAYGLETELSWKGPKTDASVYYTLSWNERFFGELYHKWFPDSHDNRHKLTLLFSHRFSEHFDMNISWHYHTGDRITESEQFTMEKNPSYDQDNDVVIGPIYPEIIHRFYHTTPNNFQLPDYHRMDLGFNWRKTTRRGNESIWNLSIYNAYCHINAVFAEVERDDEGKVKAYQYGLIPIIPMCSWTLKF